ncbi:hypothetical protein I4U23_004969 [Adineta vaga]|nr:hypothetical protein I4U23_004969 [Adineta vaga]
MMIVANQFYYFLLIFFSITVQLKSQICLLTNNYDSCSTNTECGCFAMLNTDGIGICAFLWPSCSQFTPCNVTDNTCEKLTTICVRHPRCHNLPVCYPTSLMDERICPSKLD